MSRVHLSYVARMLLPNCRPLLNIIDHLQVLSYQVIEDSGDTLRGRGSEVQRQ